jgi:hypothetical protein
MNEHLVFRFKQRSDFLELGGKILLQMLYEMTIYNPIQDKDTLFFAPAESDCEESKEIQSEWLQWTDFRIIEDSNKLIIAFGAQSFVAFEDSNIVSMENCTEYFCLYVPTTARRYGGQDVVFVPV